MSDWRMGITDEEIDKMNALAQRYVDSGKRHSALTEDEWDFIGFIGAKIIQNTTRKPT